MQKTYEPRSARPIQATDLDTEADNARTTLTTLSGPGKALNHFIDDLEAVDDIADVQASLSRRYRTARRSL